MSAAASTERVLAQNTWFAKRSPEETLDPELEICDAHHHLWHHPGNRYLDDEYLADVRSGHRIVSSVYVECVSNYRVEGPEHLRPLGEIEFVEQQAQELAARASENGTIRLCAGIVGFADLGLGERIAEVLDAQLAISDRFCGIRHATAWDASPQIRQAHTQPGPALLSDPRFRCGFAQLAPRKLSFDAWVFHPQIAELTALAKVFPDTTIVLDHLGGPLGIGPYAGRADEVFAAWKPLIRDLAQCPNVFIKLGGIHMAINGGDWRLREIPVSSIELAAATEHWYLHAIECFGVDRCMFESNFPADRISVSYGVLWNTFKRITRSFSAPQKQWLFRDTAHEVYGIVNGVEAGPSIGSDGALPVR